MCEKRFFDGVLFDDAVWSLRFEKYVNVGDVRHNGFSITGGGFYDFNGVRISDVSGSLFDAQGWVGVQELCWYDARENKLQLPPKRKIKKMAWVNIWPVGIRKYDSEDEALRYSNNKTTATVQIFWEEG